jgi:hypothetical protein
MCPMCYAMTAYVVVGATTTGGAAAILTAKVIKTRHKAERPNKTRLDRRLENDSTRTCASKNSIL